MTKTARDQLTRIERRAIIIVALHRHQHGTGPSFGQLARQLGLTRQDGVRLIRRLHRAGLLASTREPHSLDATPDGLRAALGKDGCR